MTELERLAGMCRQTARKAANGAQAAVEYSKRKLDVLALENRKSKVEQQLGALIYILHKSGETNTVLIKRYLETIARIDEKLENGISVKEDLAHSNDDMPLNICLCCGTECAGNAEFCRACGEKLV